jgi:hypothetical protein
LFSVAVVLPLDTLADLQCACINYACIYAVWYRRLIFVVLDFVARRQFAWVERIGGRVGVDGVSVDVEVAAGPGSARVNSCSSRSSGTRRVRSRIGRRRMSERRKKRRCCCAAAACARAASVEDTVACEGSEELLDDVWFKLNVGELGSGGLVVC